MSAPYLEFATARRMQALLASTRSEDLKFRSMLSWTYLVVVRETMLATCPDRYRFKAGFRRENTDVAGFGEKLAGIFLFAYDYGFRGPDELSGPLLSFFEEELAAFVAWAGEHGAVGIRLWQEPGLLAGMTTRWYDDLSPSAPRQLWFKATWLSGGHAQLFSDLETWDIFG